MTNRNSKMSSRDEFIVLLSNKTNKLLRETTEIANILASSILILKGKR